ncbi:MAG: KAP family NTPase [Bacteroidales bacterium]|nr:KAP family NTPase [Bacteroidales bacterium]
MKNEEKGIKFPRFISNSPCKEDLFKGNSHKNIAENIAQLLQNNENCNVIGIDGGWGSGKSNLVELVKKCLDVNEKTKGKFRFFLYDAWGHQDDLQRRSILEELTEYLTKGNEKETGILGSDKWKEKLKELLAKQREVKTKTIPKISLGIILSVLAVVITPVLEIITDSIESTIWKIIIRSLPIALFLFLVIYYIIRNLMNSKGNGVWNCIKSSMTDLFYIYSDRQKEDTTFETISEDEPSSRKFKDWMHDIDKDIHGYTLMVVFDNMDRLPSRKVQELWSAIHTFFADESYENIRVIVPFDREHIKFAFKNEDIADSNKSQVNGYKVKSFGDDYINKTFNVVYRVSPPTMSNWKEYFQMQWEYAFGNDGCVDNSVTQIYDLLTPDQTPRKIIAFINEFVTIKQLTEGDNIPDKYIALFILGKSKITNNPNEILTPSYLGPLGFMYKDDENLPKYISALYYQLSANEAIDIIYTAKLKRALDENDTEQIKSIQSNPTVFYSILENAITQVTNIPNATLALHICLANEANAKTRRIWDCVYCNEKKTVVKEYLQEYQKILIGNITQKDEYLHTLINAFYYIQDFDVNKYCDSIRQLSEIEGIDPFTYLSEKEVEADTFIKFVEHTKDTFRQYKIVCGQEKINAYFSGLNVDMLSTLSIIPILRSDYDLTAYSDHLKSLIDENLNNKGRIETIYSRLKEVEKPITKILPDTQIHSFFTSTNDSEDFYYDLICMRMSRLTNFHPNFQRFFNQVLSSSDSILVKKIADRIGYYISYGDILINVGNMNSQLFNNVAKMLTEKGNDLSSIDIVAILQKYETIKTNLSVDKTVLFNRLDELCEGDTLSNVTIDEFPTIPIAFFEDINSVENNLKKHCYSLAEEYLNAKSKDQWKQSIVDIDFDFKLLKIVKAKVQNCFDAFKEALIDKAKGEISNLTKETVKFLIELSEKNNRELLSAFNNVRDVFCNGNVAMTVELFDFYGEWLLKYSKLEEKSASLRTIFIPSVLDKQENVQLILKYQTKMINIVNIAGKENTDFKDKLESLLKDHKNDDQLKEFASKIGIKLNFLDKIKDALDAK